MMAWSDLCWLSTITPTFSGGSGWFKRLTELGTASSVQFHGRDSGALLIDLRDNGEGQDQPPAPQALNSWTGGPPYGAVLALPQRLTLRSRMFLPGRRSTIAELHLLQKENDGVRTEIVKLRHELTNKQGYAERLEVLLRELLERIDDLNGKLEQAREQNKRLKAEAEHQAAMAGGPSMLRAWLTKLRALTPQSQRSDCEPPARRVTG